MKKSYLFLLTLLFITTLVNAQNCNLQWKVKSNFTLNQFVTDSLGNSYAVGTTDSTKILITKYNQLGTILWEKDYPLTGGIKLANIHTAQMDKDYNLILVGTYTSLLKNAGIFVLKYLSTGNLGWFAVADNNGKNSSIVEVELKTDHLFITAKSDNNTLYLLNYHLTGTLNWSSSYTDPHTGNLTFIKSMTDDANNIYVATTLTATDSTFITIHKYDITGNLKWRNLNFEGIIIQNINVNLDFYVTNLGTSYTALKNKSQSDTIIVKSYNSNGNVELIHYQCEGKLFSNSCNSSFLHTRLGIYGNDDNYILYLTAIVDEKGNTTCFAQYDKMNVSIWKYAINGTSYSFIRYNNKTNQILASGRQPAILPWGSSPATFMKLNTITGEVALISASKYSYPGSDFLVTKKNNVFWLIAESYYHVTKLNVSQAPAVVCEDFVNNGNNGQKFFKIQTDKFENLYMAYHFQNKDSVYIEKYSTSLTVKEQPGLATVLVLYPNPANNLITIASEQLSSFKTIQVINNLGQVVQAEQLNANGLKEYKITIKELPIGVYTIILNNGDLKISKRFIKME